MARRIAQRVLRRWWVVLLLGYTAVNTGRLVLQEVRLVHQDQILSHDRSQVEARRRELVSEIAEARSLPGVEHAARRELALARPQEVPVVLLADAKPRVSRYPIPPSPPATPSAL